MNQTAASRSVTIDTLRDMKSRGEKIASLTSYDASFTHLLEEAGVEVLIVGDSLGMVLMGHPTTLPVTMEHMLYHAACVARAGRRALRVVDFPSHSYDSPAQALHNARRLVDEGGADLVKLEGGIEKAGVVQAIVDYGIPVCGHVGMLPQSVERYGGFRVQGRDTQSAAAILADARALQDAGASLLVIECVPSGLAEEITASVSMPTIGIGAGPGCDGQVLVLYDMLGITTGKRPRFVHDFLAATGSIPAALSAYVADVKSGVYPAPEHCYGQDA